MTNSKPESRLVHRLMPDATEAEIEEATSRWFRFLNTLYEIVLEREQCDSQDSGADDRFKNEQKSV